MMQLAIEAQADMPASGEKYHSLQKNAQRLKKG
jgi:hypothetical protein